MKLVQELAGKTSWRTWSPSVATRNSVITVISILCMYSQLTDTASFEQNSNDRHGQFTETATSQRRPIDRHGQARPVDRHGHLANTASFEQNKTTMTDTASFEQNKTMTDMAC